MISFGSEYISADALHTVILYCAGFFCVLTLLQIIILIIHKLILERLNRNRSLMKNDYLYQLQQAIQRNDFQFIRPHTKMQYEVFADVCIDLMSHCLPEQVEIIQNIVRQLGVHEFFVKGYVHTRSWTRKYQIVEKLGFFKLPEFGKYYRDFLGIKNENSLVLSKLIWALSLICRESDLPVILNFIYEPDFMSAKFDEYIFCNVINSFIKNNEIEILVDYFKRAVEDESVPFIQKRDFIQACGALRLREAESLILLCFRRLETISEIKIACIRAIQSIGGEHLDNMVASGLSDKDWRVRAVAAKDTSRCSERVIKHLEQVLGDQNYYVRMSSAISLGQMGDSGIAILRTQSQSDDRFIRDVSKFVLAS